VDQVLILEVHRVLFHPTLNMSWRNDYLRPLFDIYLEDKI